MAKIALGAFGSISTMNVLAVVDIPTHGILTWCCGNPLIVQHRKIKKQNVCNVDYS
jgi:hypothetical protein